jgi:FtsH-binding integral membrane protein
MQDASEPLLGDREDEGDSSASQIAPEEEVLCSKGDFIRKIYRILTGQLLLNVALVVLLVENKELQELLKTQPAECVLIPVLVMMGLIFMLAYRGELARKPPFNYFLLVFFSLTEAVLVATFSLCLPTESVLVSQVMMAGVTLLVLLYAELSKDKFASSLGLPIAIFSTVIVFAVCIRIHDSVSRLEVILCTLAAVLFSFYVVIDIQVLAMGERFGLAHWEHVAGSLYLYIDVGNMLWSCVALGVDSLPLRSF